MVCILPLFSQLWDHMNKMAAVLLCTADVMKGLQWPSYLAIKEMMASPTRRYTHHYPEQKHSSKPPQIILTGDEDYKEHFEIAGMYVACRGIDSSSIKKFSHDLCTTS